MAEAVGKVGRGDGANGSDDEDGDAPDLGGGGCVAQFADYGGGRRRRWRSLCLLFPCTL